MSHVSGLVIRGLETHRDLNSSMSDDQDAEQRPPISRELLKWISREYFGKSSSPCRWGGPTHSQNSGMNGSSYHVLDYPPTPLEFARLAHLSRPAVIKGITPNLRHTSEPNALLLRGRVPGFDKVDRRLSC